MSGDVKTQRLIKMAFGLATVMIEQAVERQQSDSDLVADALVLAGLAGELQMIDSLVNGEYRDTPAAAMRQPLEDHLQQAISRMLLRIEPPAKPLWH